MTMMKKLAFYTLLFLFSLVLVLPTRGFEPKFKKLVLSTDFDTEGAAAADFNNDGVIDVAAGPYWYEGPEFTQKHQIYEGQNYDPEGYSISFLNFTYDFNGDGWADLLVCPHPGQTGYWYENPKGEEKLWEPHEASIELANESQNFLDIDGDGAPELVFNRIGKFGFAKPNKENPYEPWTFYQVSPDDPKYQHYYHGSGAGDINGDGKVDLIEKDGWYEQPESIETTPWPFHPFHFADAASHLLVSDVDGDGVNDVITAMHCHLYGLVWWKQIRAADGSIDFEKHELIPSEPADDFFPKVSQLHSFSLVDLNGDGIDDFVTGKRYLAHGSHGDINPFDPPVLLWYEIQRTADGPVLTPHVIDEDSGVGTQVWTGLINGDDRPDILVGNKHGVFVFLSE